MNEPIFDKQPEESPSAYEGFTLYRNLPVRQRSIDAAFRLSKHEGSESGAKRANSRWFRWAAENQWVRRAEAWDAEQERLDREEARETRRQEVEAYRVKVVEGARERAEAATMVLRLVAAGLETARVKGLSLPALVVCFEKASRVVEASARLEGIGLGLMDEDGKLIGTE